ncbi:MAG: adenylosuccinate synthase [Chloroflexi bacterium]|nr:adenylosuccinate synthase [Chloroflexota bacterium]
MPAYVIVGAQWGDEGKGKIIDYLSEKAHVVARYSGGNNAGHTVINEKGEFRLHLVPAGIFWPHTTCLIGNGVVVDAEVLWKEMEELRAKDVDVSRLQISDKAHLIMPYHIALDKLEEQARGNKALGTTSRGVGPAYVDKAGRSGIRLGDILDHPSLLPRLQHVLEQKNFLITRLYNAEPFSLEELYERCIQWGERLSPYIHAVENTARRALAENKVILLEGAQGSLLDLDHGTYPYVTSSSPTAGGACTGLGLSPMAIAGIFGVYKAYTTRVGAGPFPTELSDSVGEAIRQKAWEYGATTGRARRCGWFDAVAARYSATVNGLTSALLTRLDVLDGIDPVKVCVAYRLNGKTITEFPSSAAVLEKCQPVYEQTPGWKGSTANVTSLDDIPEGALRYVKRLEELIGCRIDVISTGPRRPETVCIRSPIP